LQWRGRKPWGGKKQGRVIRLFPGGGKKGEREKKVRCQNNRHERTGTGGRGKKENMIKKATTIEEECKKRRNSSGR